MMLLRPLISLLLVSSTALSFASAQAAPMPAKSTGAETHQHASASTRTKASHAYESVMATMHNTMHVPLSGNADIDFVRQMIPHHQAAVDMAKIQLTYGHDEQLKRFNRWIIRFQEFEIGQMKNWLRRRDDGAVARDAHDYYGEAMTTMHHGMMIEYSGDADADFVRGMIPHHQGAVDMASILFSDGSDPEMNQLAKNIWRSQTYEIAWMQDWLRQHTRH